MHYLTKMSPEKLMYQKGPIWAKFEKLLAKKILSFEESVELGELYQQTLEDLSFCQTRFPGEHICMHLSNLIVRAHLKMHKNKRVPFSGIIRFFVDKLPNSMSYIIREFLLSILIFCVAVLISSFMVHSNPEFGEMFLSESLYQEAISDLENYKHFSHFDDVPENKRGSLSVAIWINNAKVAVVAFAMGATAGVGTLLVLVYNSVVLGSLGSIYFTNGHFADFISIILVHGSLELTAIFMATASGFCIGRALLFPGRCTRKAALKTSVQHAFNALIGIIILLFISALIEGVVTTRNPDMMMRWIIIGINFLSLGSYFGYALLRSGRDSYK